MLKLFRFLRPYRWGVALVMALVLLQSLSELYLPTLMADIVNKGVIGENQGYIWKMGGFMLLVTLGGTAFSILASYYSSKVASGFGLVVRGKVFSHVENFSLQEFDKLGTASLITRTTNDINQVQQVLIMMMRMMIMAPMMSIGGLIMALSKDAKLTLVLAVAIPVLALTIYLIVRKAMPHFKSIQKRLDKLNLVLREGLTGIRVIRSFNRLEHEKKRFEAANAELTDTSIKVNQIMAFMMPLMMLIMNFVSLSIIWFGGIRISHEHMQVGDLMAFLQYGMQIMFSLLMMSMMFVMVPRASASAVRINEVLQQEAVIRDTDGAGRAGAGSLQSKRGTIEFADVTFSYPGAEQPALSGISFKANPGEITAIIGGTGSGKSSIINLIPRFYDADSGSVRIDGRDVRDYTQEQLRAKIGLVPQKAVLFTGTIADNIRFGREDASDDEVRHAAEIAQASGFIEEMQEGFGSPIAQGGSNVSGGQKQRISIARALVRKPDIYLFDDSFSALDYKTDAKLRAALRSETTEAAVMIVAQRVSTIMDADQIIVLDEGRVVGIGKHKELLKSCEVYREIVASQLSEEEIA
ncbi:ABC transporter ATP-binding protein [Cohnella thailandensis]|uniref:ABC transporter ATP-binding protein n=1 Tax=Cohnella thailandensis TaxID=557557 RepID=A0A841T0J4_9BACL|nr:ABC transporter ATP-binding protein [Cohnella thailandensis]MBB6635600.1 ABC transporter ATP-binding protein [Cohnella thailandensis]MBP1974980.1 ATP-binding cassette subfamily B protein [Cohnella thailandensis]